ncbi:flagellar protein FlaF [Methanococcus maripaludis]|uniref:Flagellar protein FlaF n=2 Tax=Methanococcus maripaludis TaxID=39152 RepID=A0A7J9PGU8_METMI|nr:flagellar protein FlaF [Methanococcus maripaludis]MBA2862321.1 flagellar protein FlaF [Methanococcus maripaludis]
MGFSEIYGVSFLSIILLISITVIYGTVDSNLNNILSANDDHAYYLLQKSKENFTIQYEGIDSGIVNLTVINNGNIFEDSSKWTVIFEGDVINNPVIETTYMEPLSRTQVYIETIYNSSTIDDKRVVVSGEFGTTFTKIIDVS